MDFGIKHFSFKENDPCVIIAEVGVNHNGDPGLAKMMVDRAVDAGVDIVKFQSFKSEKEISRFAPKTPYQAETTSPAGNQLDMCKKLELGEETIKAMKSYCDRLGAGFLCTAFESESVDFIVDGLGIDTIKVPSGEVTNIPLLEYIGSRCDGAVLSTGASTLSEVGRAVDALRDGGCRELLLLHCVTSYPADYKDVNLRAMDTMRSAFRLPVGYSDHTPGISVPIAAAALGASAIEKHFTLDRSLPGPDHRASIEPDDLKGMVRSVREAESALGDAEKKPRLCEMPNLGLIRKSLVASRKLKPGTVISRDMIEIKRPAAGIEPLFLKYVTGMRLVNEVEEDAPIRWEDLK